MTIKDGAQDDNNILSRAKRTTSNETLLEFTVTTEGDVFENGTEIPTTEATLMSRYEQRVNQTETFFDELYHFTEYTIEVQACQSGANTNTVPCSISAITSIRTLPLGNVFVLN